MPSDSFSPSSERDRAILVAVLCFYAVGYAALCAAGSLFFVYKTLVIPGLIVSALLTKRTSAMASDWLPFLGLTALFDAIRGAIFVFVDAGYRPIYVAYPAVAEQWLTGVPSVSLVAQAALSGPTLDRVMVSFHGSHFLFFLMFGLVVWHARRPQFRQFTTSFTFVMAVGLVCYLWFPTAPPFIAADQIDALRPIRRIVLETYTRYIPEIYGSFDTNPVAAMPSLHVAFPATCLMLSYRLFSRRATLLIGFYTAIICFSVLYLGEHYLVDVIAGLILAAGAVSMTKPRSPKDAPTPLALAVVVSGVLVGVALWIMALTRAHFGGDP